MHFLRALFARNEKRLPELRRRTGAPTAAAGRATVDSMSVNPQGIGPCGSLHGSSL